MSALLELKPITIWIIGLKGRVSFFLASEPDKAVKNSRVCPDFPCMMEPF